MKIPLKCISRVVIGCKMKATYKSRIKRIAKKHNVPVSLATPEIIDNHWDVKIEPVWNF